MPEKTQKIVVCGLIHRDQKILIAKRAATKKFLPNQWELSGGHVEFGETLEETLYREVQEELHLAIKIGPIYTAFTYFTGDKATHEVEVVYFATLVDPKQEPQLNEDDHSEYRWITSAEGHELLNPTHLETPIIQNAFASLGEDPNY